MAELPNVQPPNNPWMPITKRKNIATISFYCGDSQSEKIPIRDSSNQYDAKRDPNIETQTYGLFSHCCKKERKAIVEQGITTQFFCTSRVNATRVLTGYYKPAWYCEFGNGDYAIAADEVRFVSPGFDFRKLIQYMDGFRIDTFFQGRSPWRYITDEKVIRKLLLLLNTAENATPLYLSEMRKQEEIALKRWGHVYDDRPAGFFWADAAKLMIKHELVKRV